MFESVRVRLTLWYSAILAIVLIALSLVTYFVLMQTTTRRIDASLAELGFAFRSAIQRQYEAYGRAPDSLQTATQEAFAGFQLSDHRLAVLTPEGTIIEVSGFPDYGQADGSVQSSVSNEMRRALKDAIMPPNRQFQNVRVGREPFRSYALAASIGATNLTIVVMQSIRSERELMADLTRTFLWAIPIAVLFAGAGGYFLARKSLAPVAAMSDQAGRISASNLHERLPVPKQRDELGQLARTVNSLLERLDQSFERQRQFMTDASHELRSPVAIIRGEAEVTLSQPSRSPTEYRESLAITLDEARHLSCIVEDLFALARADAGQYPLRPHDFYLDELVTDCVRTSQSLAKARNIALTHVCDSEMLLHADEELIRRMVVNLLGNAIKYTPEGGTVSVECRRVQMDYSISVTDTGPGIPPDAQEHIFERFFRLDKARSHSETQRAGAGLGLSIARWIAQAHHGRLQLLRSDSSGSVFAAFIPSGQADSSSDATSVR